MPVRRRRRDPDAWEAIREAVDAMERAADAAGRALMARIDRLRDAAAAGGPAPEGTSRDSEAEAAGDLFRAHLKALRAIHGEDRVARNLEALFVARSVRALARLARARGAEVVDRTDNL